jgi:predicted small lipoprotein YifL
MKKILCLMMAVLIIAALAGCRLTGNVGITPATSPTDYNLTTNDRYNGGNTGNTKNHVQNDLATDNRNNNGTGTGSR